MSSIVPGGVLRARPGSPQEHLLECPYGDILFGGGRGGGKSWGTILKIKQHHDTYRENASILVLRRTFEELKHFIKVSKRLLPSDNWVYKVGAKKFVHRETEAEIILSHLDDEDASSVQGHEYTMIVVEEAGNFETPEPIDQLFGTMRSGAGVSSLLLMTANPGGVGNDWLKERYVDPAPGGYVPLPVEGTPFTRYYIHSTLDDNKDLTEADPTYAAKLSLTGPPQLVKAWLTGDWTAAPQGPVFKREYFTQTYNHGAPPSFLRIVQCWDTGFKTGKKNDRSACTTWGVTRNGDVYLLHAWAGKVEFPDLKATAKQLYAAWRPHIVYVEDKASGISLIQELKRDTTIPIKAVSTDSDKLARAYAITPLWEAGKVWIPKDAQWLFEYVEELCSFPKGKYDDFVDSTSHALSRVIHFVNSMENRERKVVPFTQSVWSV